MFSKLQKRSHSFSSARATSTTMGKEGSDGRRPTSLIDSSTSGSYKNRFHRRLKSSTSAAIPVASSSAQAKGSGKDRKGGRSWMEIFRLKKRKSKLPDLDILPVRKSEVGSL